MHRRNILLLCFLHITLISALPTYIPDQPTHKNTSFPATRNITVFATNSSAVKLKWKLLPTEDEKSVQEWRLSYHSKSHVYAPATLEHDPYEEKNHFVAVKSRELSHDKGHSGRDSVWAEFCKNYMLITVSDLKYPGVNYEFELNRTLWKGQDEKIKLIRKTKISVHTIHVPPDPPKTGVGCFHIYESNVDQQRRTVKIYWQRNRSPHYYVVDIYEEEQSEPSYGDAGRLDKGWMMARISWKRHYFVLKSINAAGQSSKSAIVNVPPQEDLLSVPSSVAVWNETEKVAVLTWQEPDNISATNYTIFWVDTLDGLASQRIFDFTYVAGDQTSVVVKGNDYVGLGLSVNTEFSSSGLKIARWV